MRRMPVVDNGVLLGQISRRDILRAARNFKPTTW
ncbi:MAG TPA: CBS domain-containing protein [Cyclobacteriaceae bacterium]|nr:CBS domain-containing protein [Cyclobacteriaceae bacterium]